MSFQSKDFIYLLHSGKCLLEILWNNADYEFDRGSFSSRLWKVLVFQFYQLLYFEITVINLLSAMLWSKI